MRPVLPLLFVAAGLLSGCSTGESTTEPKPFKAGVVPAGEINTYSINEGYPEELVQDRVYLGRIIRKTPAELTPAGFPFRRMAAEYKARFGQDCGDKCPAWMLLVELPRNYAGAKHSLTAPDIPPLPVTVYVVDGAGLIEGGWVNVLTRGTAKSGYTTVIRTTGSHYNEGFSASLAPDSDMDGTVLSRREVHIFPDAASYKRCVADGEHFLGYVFADTADETNGIEYVVETRCPRGVRKILVMMPRDCPFNRGSAVTVRTHGTAGEGYAEVIDRLPPSADNVKRLSPDE